MFFFIKVSTYKFDEVRDKFVGNADVKNHLKKYRLATVCSIVLYITK